MREFRCESEVIRKGYMLLAGQVSKSIELGTLDVYEPLQLVVIDDVVVHWYAGDPFKGKFRTPPHDEHYGRYWKRVTITKNSFLKNIARTRCWNWR